MKKLEEKIRLLEREIEDRRRAEAGLWSMIREKDVLLREVHHRVKNNMQVISSLLNLQADRSREPRVREALQESQNRVAVMALVHETLYRSETMAKIDFGQYLNALIGVLSDAYGAPSKGIAVTFDCDEVRVSVDHAMPCGLALNELISNALKHGFPNGGPGEVAIRLRCREDGYLVCRIRDNGVGLPSGMDWRNLKTLGLTLVVGLVEDQLKGSVEARSVGGTEFILTYRP